MKITNYCLLAPTEKTYRIALLADLHSHIPKNVLDDLTAMKPDIITVAGDLIDGTVEDAPHMLPFLSSLTRIAPTFYAGGNHELFHEEDRDAVRKTGAFFLQNQSIQWRELTVGGISSGFGFSKQGRLIPTPPPDLDFLKRFSAHSGYKLLLSHHPEYYKPYLAPLNIDLIFSGHAHGGQWRLFGRGLFAPGQGLFPRYTSGVHDGRLVVSRGMGGHIWIPRIFNAPELILVTLQGKDCQSRKQ